MLLIVVAIVWMIPFYFLVIVAVKPDVEALQSPLELPGRRCTSRNFSTAWNDAALDRSLVNSLIITGGSVLALIAIGSICAYAIARRPGRMSTALYFLFVLAIILPFQLGLVPTYAVMRDLGLVGSYLGIILLYTGIWMPFSVFLYTGFVHGAAEGVRGGVARRRRDVAADVPEGRLPAAAAGDGDRRDLHGADHLERLLPLADLPQRHGQDAAAGRRLHVRRRVRLAVEPDLRRRDRLAPARS